MHCHTAGAQWAMELLLCTATVPGDSGLCSSNPKMQRVQSTPSTKWHNTYSQTKVSETKTSHH